MNKQILSIVKDFDDRRDIAIPGDYPATIDFCVEHFLLLAERAIHDRKIFNVALSGGSTPKAIFNKLASCTNKIDWRAVKLFWSDERCVPLNDPDSNYHMAMTSGIQNLPIPEKNIFRMPADAEDVEQAALNYEKVISDHVPDAKFDLVMLGMGEDGHTASLFPKTHGLHVESHRLVIANFIPQKEIWRMSFTFEAINAARHTAIYVLGKSKAQTVKTVLTSSYNPDQYPIQKVGTREHKALWILDTEAASLINT